jgi:sterol desaturase/sphingolipid hydroxylase (fatty acid hydroxylase superfamily)
MSVIFLGHSDSIRLGAFSSVLLVMALWEALAPRRIQTHGRLARWPNNLALVLVDALAVRLVIPTSLAGFAGYAATQRWGMFNQIPLPAWIAVIASVLSLDLAIYAQHVAFHAVPAFWRVHRMHHSDLEIDVTTGIRFHPVEILLSVLVKMAVIAIIGAPAVAVLMFEVLLNAMAMFNHSNTRMPEWLDAVLRPLLVTPDMHRVHHSIVRAETDSNYGFNLSVWDRMFGTYRQEPVAGQLGMTIGIPAFRKPEELRIDKMLKQPFRET